MKYGHSFALLFTLLIGSPAILNAQTEDLPKPCTHARLTESVTVQGYIFRAYEDKDFDIQGCVRIYRGGKLVYQLANDHDLAYRLGQPVDPANKIPHVLNGSDLVGNGRPQMMVTAWSGGAHCCFTRYIFELEPKLRLIAMLEDGDTNLGHFEDLDHNGHYYYVTEDIWSYWPSSFASSVRHKVILRWNGGRFVLDLTRMRRPPPTSQQWQSALKNVDDVLKSNRHSREALAATLWDTTLNLIYTGHSDLAWQFVREVNPQAFESDNPTLEEFCGMLKSSVYWQDLEPALKEMPPGCARAKRKIRD